MAQHTPHRESVAVVTEDARRYGGGIHRSFADPTGMTQIDIEFGDLVTAVAFTTAVRAAFAVGVELRDAVSSLWSPVVVTITVTDTAHHQIVRQPRERNGGRAS